MTLEMPMFLEEQDAQPTGNEDLAQRLWARLLIEGWSSDELVELGPQDWADLRAAFSRN